MPVGHSKGYWRRKKIIAAKELGYPKEVIDKLENAKDEREGSRIMCDARMESIEKDWDGIPYLDLVYDDDGKPRINRRLARG